MEALAVVSEDTVYLICLCLQSVFRAALRSAEQTKEMRELVENAIEVCGLLAANSTARSFCFDDQRVFGLMIETQRAWQSCREVTVNSVEAYHEFIQLAFDPVVFGFMQETAFHEVICS